MKTTPIEIPEWDNWLIPLRAIGDEHAKAFGAMPAADAAAALVKYNLQRTFVKLAATPFMATAIISWPLTLQGEIYDVGTDLLMFTESSDVEPAVENPVARTAPMSAPLFAPPIVTPPIVTPATFDCSSWQ